MGTVYGTAEELRQRMDYRAVVAGSSGAFSGSRYEVWPSQILNAPN